MVPIGTRLYSYFCVNKVTNKLSESVYKQSVDVFLSAVMCSKSSFTPFHRAILNLNADRSRRFRFQHKTETKRILNCS